MKMKKIMSVLLTITIILCLVACNNKPHKSTESTEPIESIDSTNSTDSTTPTINQGGDPVVIVDEKFVWEKEAVEIVQKTIKLGEDWDQVICVDNSTVYSYKATDLSVIPNYYYYTENDSYADLETLYYVPTFMFSATSKNTQLDTYTFADMSILCTTLERNNSDKNAIIDEIRFVCVTNPYEGGFDTFRAGAYSYDGQFGMGSEYEYVISIIGDPKDQTTDQLGNGLNITTCVYTKESAEMILSFMWFENEGIDSAVLMSIDWIAIDVREILQSQKNIEFFEGYHDFMNNHLDAVEPTDLNDSLAQEATIDTLNINTSDNQEYDQD